VLNPKVALFFLALLPQFIDPDSPTKIAAFLALGFTFIATGTAWVLVLALGAAHIRGFFAERPRVLANLSRASGGLFVLLGLRLAVSERYHQVNSAPESPMPAEEGRPYEGGCDCHAVRYRMTSAPLFVHCCHCRWCQRESGSSFALNAMIEADRVIL